MADMIKTVIEPNDNIGSAPSKVVFHHFSVGGFLFGQMLRQIKLEEDPVWAAKFADFETKVVAQIFDSPPGTKLISI
jgi:hypothetical protein